MLILNKISKIRPALAGASVLFCLYVFSVGFIAELPLLGTLALVLLSINLDKLKCVERILLFIWALIGAADTSNMIPFIGIIYAFIRTGLFFEILCLSTFVVSWGYVTLLIQNLASFEINSIHLVNFLPWILPLSFLILEDIYYKNVFCNARGILLVFVLVLFLFAMGSEGILPIDLFTNTIYQYLFTFILGAVLYKTCREKEVVEQKSIGNSVVFILFSCLIVTLVYSFPKESEIKEIVFDESHGNWETVKESFSPKDYGRGKYYTYSELAKRSKSHDMKVSLYEDETQELPTSRETLFVIKTPSRNASPEFVNKFTHWIKNGGKALLIADHTDLYDSTQIINTIVKDFGIEIDSTACFSRTGMPNETNDSILGVLQGRIDAGKHVSWLTGTNFKKTPFFSHSLLTYGPAFSEDANYANANRFGNFYPNWSKAYYPFSGALVHQYGEGNLTIFLDSTPWSNFSVFKEEYQDLYKACIGVSTENQWLWIKKICVVFLFVFVLVVLIRPARKGILPFILGVVLLGISFGVNVRVAASGNSVNFQTKTIVYKGDAAHTEFLNEKLKPYAANYSRIISSLGKFNLEPTEVECDYRCFNPSADLIYFNPNYRQLPDAENVLALLKNGRKMVFIFSENQANDRGISDWLKDLNIYVKKLTSIQSSTLYNDSNDYLKESVNFIERRTRIATYSGQSSLLIQKDSGGLFDSYALRKINNNLGELWITFSDQLFQDMNMGDVWEGSLPSSYGVRAEKILSNILSNRDLNLELENVVKLEVSENLFPSSKLKKYLFIVNGRKIEQGTITNSVDKQKIAKIRDLVEYFIYKNCSGDSVYYKNVCNKRLMLDDNSEWVVRWLPDKDGEIKMVEMNHLKSFSAPSDNLTIILGK